MAGYATSGRGWHNPAVAGLLRRDERVHAQSIKLVDCLRRVIASIGGYFPGDCAYVVSMSSADIIEVIQDAVEFTGQPTAPVEPGPALLSDNGPGFLSHQPRLLAQRQYLYEQGRHASRLSLRKSEMVRKSGVLFAANTLKAMSSWRRWAMRREDATPTQ